MIGLAFDLLLAGLILAAAVAAVAGRDRFGAVVFFIVYGVLAALAWVRLGATDVALAEAAIGAGLTGVLLVGAVASLARPRGAERSATTAAEAAPPHRLRPAAAALAAAVAGLTGWAVLSLDPDGAGLAAEAGGRLAETGLGNPVTGVLLAYRAWDTLLESIVLLAALVGVWSLARDADWPGRPGLVQSVRPDGVLATFGRTLPPVGLMVGVYLVWRGADAPGGAFQGGTVLAAVWLLVALAGRTRARSVLAPRLRLALVAGPAVFLAVGLAGAVAGRFLALPPWASKPAILGIEAALTLSIAATLALLVLGPPRRGGGGTR